MSSKTSRSLIDTFADGKSSRAARFSFFSLPFASLISEIPNLRFGSIELTQSEKRKWGQGAKPLVADRSQRNPPVLPKRRKG